MQSPPQPSHLTARPLPTQAHTHRPPTTQQHTDTRHPAAPTPSKHPTLPSPSVHANNKPPLSSNEMYTAIIDACKYAYLAMREGRWTKPDVERFLRTHGIRHSQIEIITEQAIADKKTGTVSEPTVYCPQAWFCKEEKKPPDLPIHLLAHGVRTHVLAQIDQTNGTLH